jgi:hypothetical protein
VSKRIVLFGAVLVAVVVVSRERRLATHVTRPALPPVAAPALPRPLASPPTPPPLLTARPSSPPPPTIALHGPDAPPNRTPLDVYRALNMTTPEEEAARSVFARERSAARAIFRDAEMSPDEVKAHLQELEADADKDLVRILGSERAEELRSLQLDEAASMLEIGKADE